LKGPFETLNLDPPFGFVVDLSGVDQLVLMLRVDAGRAGSPGGAGDPVLVLWFGPGGRG
jgi:hypothetical protein